MPPIHAPKCLQICQTKQQYNLVIPIKTPQMESDSYGSLLSCQQYVQKSTSNVEGPLITTLDSQTRCVLS